MMKVFNLPPSWDANKFASRYGLDYRRDFYVDGTGKLVVFPVISDDPPIFEAADPPPPSITSLVQALPGNVPQALKDILLRLAAGR